MKKLSLVMAAAMCATVGGVYASWNYADEALINYNSTYENISVNITNPTYNGAVLSVNTVRDGLGLVIDGAEIDITPDDGINETTANVAKLLASGSLKFDFTPAATSDIEQVQLTLKVTHKVNVANESEHPQYDGRTILVPDAQVSPFQKVIDVTPGETSAVQTYTLAEIFEETGFGLNGYFVVPTPNAYDNFKAQVSKITEVVISIEVTPIYAAAALPAQG